MKMRFIAPIVACVLHASLASAAPIPFAAVVSAPGFDALEVTFGPTLTLASADVNSLTHPSDPVFGESAPVFVDEIPSVGGAALGYFKMPEIPQIGILNNGTTTFASFGPGSFSIGMVNPVFPFAPLLPFVDATFSSVLLAVQNDGSGGIAIGSVMFSGLAFTNSGLDNPGSFLFTLGSRSIGFEDQMLQFEYPIAFGVLAAEATPIPEPASLVLLGTGLAGCAARARRKKLSKR